MTYLMWRPEFRLDVELMDLQHRDLVEALNDLYNGVMDACEADELSLLLTTLRHRTVSHFQAEETLMQSVGYPGYQVHREIHEELLRQMDLLMDRLEHHSLVMSSGILGFLRDWLIDHILGEDRTLAAFVKRGRSS